MVNLNEVAHRASAGGMLVLTEPVSPNGYHVEVTRVAMNYSTLCGLIREAGPNSALGINPHPHHYARICGRPVLIDGTLADGEVKYLTEVRL